jgi:hypothetical protein
MTKKQYLKYLMSKEIDSLSSGEQQFFFDNIGYEIIEEWIDECMTAALIEDITEGPSYFREELNVNKLLKDLENKK